MSVTPGSTTKASAQASAQPNIASFFAKKSEGASIGARVTPSFVTGKEKKTMVDKEVIILTEDNTNSSAKKESAKAKQDISENHAGPGEAAYCPVTPASQHISDAADASGGEESLNRLVSNTDSPTVHGVADDDEERAGSDADADAAGPTGGKLNTKKRVPKKETTKSKAAAKPAAKRARKTPTLTFKTKSASSNVDDSTPPTAEETAEPEDEGASAASEGENTGSPVNKRKRSSKASAKAIEAKESAGADPDMDADGVAESFEAEADADAEAGIAQTPGSALKASSARPKSSSSKKVKQETAVTFEELPLAVQVKIQTYEAKMAAAVAELLKLETDPEHIDNDLEVDEAVAEFLEMLQTADSYAAAAEANAAVATEKAAEGPGEDASKDMGEAESGAPPKTADAALDDSVSNQSAEPADTGDIEPAAAGESAPPLIQFEDADTRVGNAVRKIIARTMQGSSDPVSKVSVSVSARLDHTLQQLNEAYADMQAQSRNSAISDKFHDVAKSSLEFLLCTPDDLEGEIKSLACREAFGVKGKNAVTFEDTSAETIWRWEVVHAVHFSKAVQSIVREAKASRKRYGALLRACSKVTEQLYKGHADEAKLVKLEELSTKAMIDISKAKEKRSELEAKRKKKEQSMMVDKAKKDHEKEEKKKQLDLDKEEKKRKAEAEKEEKRKEKETETQKKKDEAAKKKEEAQQEKQAAKDRIKDEEVAKLSKQKNLMMSMFGSATKPAAAATPAASSSSANRTPFAMKPFSLPKNTPLSAQKSPASAAASTGVVDLTHNTSSNEDAAAAMDTGAPDEASDPSLPPAFDTDAFLASMRAGMTLEDCLRRDLPRVASQSPVDLLKTLEPRGKRKLKVTLSAVSTGFGQEGYAEVCEVAVDAYMRTFYFCDDHKRPAYFGTRSKTSSIISGRTPFAEDHNLVNYDYDSEDDYDEEADGEDIAESEDEDDEGGNDLEFDEFFRHDNDFGSDADSDGEMMAAVAMKSRPGEEKLGLRFLRDENGKWQQQSRGSAGDHAPSVQALRVSFGENGDHSAVLVPCVESEKDVTRLRNYGTIVFADARSMPFLGWSEVPVKKPKEGRKSSELEAEDAGAEAAMAVGEGGETEKKSKKAPKIKADAKPAVPKNMDDALLPALIKKLHGSKDGLDKIVADFFASHASESCTKANVMRKIKEIAQKTKSEEGNGTARWVVKADVISSLGLTTGLSVEGEGATVFDIESIVFTPPRVKRARPVKDEKSAAGESSAPPPKSARLRGDTSAVVKALGSEWWPDNAEEQPKEAGEEALENAEEEDEEEEDDDEPMSAEPEIERPHVSSSPVLL